MLPYLIQLLAQWTEHLVASQDVAGSSPARPAGSAVFPTRLFHVPLVWCMLRWGRAFRLAREPVGVLLCSHSSQSSSGTGWVYSACGGMVDTPE